MMTVLRISGALLSTITQKYLRKAFRLNHETGELLRRIEVQGRMTLEDKPAGCSGDNGRWEISVLGRIVRRHKLVYLYVRGGKMPELINHINGDLTDDRPENLRRVTASQRNMGR